MIPHDWPGVAELDDADTLPFSRTASGEIDLPARDSVDRGPVACGPGTVGHEPALSVVAGLRELRDARPTTLRQRAIHDRFDLGGEGGEA